MRGVGGRAGGRHPPTVFILSMAFPSHCSITKYSWNATKIATPQQRAVCSAMLCICLFNLIRFLCRSVDNLFGSALFICLEVS